MTAGWTLTMTWNISETACTFPSMIPAASRCMARCQGSSTIRWPLPTASCALCRTRRGSGMYTTHSARLRAMALCGCAVWRPQTRWIPPFSPCCAWRWWCFRFLCCWPLWAGMCWRGALSARCGALRRRRVRSAKETICRAALRWGKGATRCIPWPQNLTGCLPVWKRPLKRKNSLPPTPRTSCAPPRPSLSLSVNMPWPTPKRWTRQRPRWPVCWARRKKWRGCCLSC